MKIRTENFAAFSAVSQHKHPPTLMNFTLFSDAPDMNLSTDVFVEQILQTVNPCSLLYPKGRTAQVFWLEPEMPN